jgi:hypothetical protein
VLAAGGLFHGAAGAQTGLAVNPSVSLAGIYDSNVLMSRSQAKEDFIARLSPAIEVAHRSARTDFQGGYTQDAEAYAQHPELGSSRARRHAATDIRYETTRQSTMAAHVGYTETQRPGELTPETGLELGRNRAERLAMAPSLAYRFDPVSVGTGSYAYTRDKVDGGIRTDTHTVALGLDRGVTARDTAMLRYAFQRFVFDDPHAAEAHVLTAGGTHAFTARTSATLLAGPRFSDGSTRPEISVSLRHRLQRGELSFDYARSQYTAIGLPGPVNTEAVGAMALYRPSRSLEIRAAPGMATSARGDFRADVYRMKLDVRRRVAPYLVLVGSYEYVMQQGALDATTEGRIVRHVLLLALAVAPGARRADEPGPGVPAWSGR